MEETALSPAPTETPTPTQPEATAPVPEAPAEAPAITAEQVAQYLGTTPEVLGEMQKYYENNGGAEKSFANMKRIMAQRQPQPQPQPTVTPMANDPNLQGMRNEPMGPMPQQPPFQRVAGGVTPQEFMTQQYFQSLASQEKYANIADQINSGEVLREMAKFNIQPIINGQFNGQQITDFLDMYAKTVPPKPTEPAMAATPTVDYVQVPGDNITNMNQAMSVLAQDREFKAMGRPGHPLAEAANKFFDDTMRAQDNRGKRPSQKK